MGIMQVMIGGLMFLLASHTLMVSALLFDLFDRCPSSSKLTACNCQFIPLSSSAVVNCDNIKSEEELKKNFNALKGYNLNVLTIENTVIPTYDVNFFEGLKIKTLELRNVSILDDSITENLMTFKGLEDSLEILEIYNSFHKGIPPKYGKLDHLKKLKSLTMADNRLIQLGDDIFSKGPKSLENIVLDRNDIQSLGYLTFNALDNLETLQFRGNSINELGRVVFPLPATELRTIDLTGNRIEVVPTDLFKFMPVLRTVRLNNNLISTITEETWPASLAARADIYLEGNPLTCDDNIKWLCNVNVDSYRSKCQNPSSRRGISLSQFCNE